MKRIGLVNFIALFFLSSVILGFMKYNEKEMREMEGIRLSYVINYCSDAAIDSMLDTDDLKADYAELGRIDSNPQLALDTFVKMFCMNYDLALTPENEASVRTNYMPVFTVATYDGYYIAKPTKVLDIKGDTSYDLAFGPKMPYLYKDSNYDYALTLGDTSYIRVKDNTMTKITGRPAGLNSKQDVIAIINKTLTDSIASAIDETNRNNTNWHNTFFIPSNLTTYTGVQPITGPSVLALVQNVDISTGKSAHAFSIAGSRIEITRMIAGYKRNDKKYYTYVDKLPPGITKDNASDMFNTPEEAASKGYECDIEYFD